MVTKTRAGALALVLGAGTFLSACDIGDTETAARFVPADAQGFVTVSIDPSLEQKTKLLALSKRLPAEVQAEKADETRDKLLGEIVKEDGLDFNADVKPWLGSEAAMALLKPYDNSNEPVAVAFLRVKDRNAAQATLDKKKVPAETYRFIDDYVVLVDKEQARDHQAAKALDTVEGLTKSGDTLQDSPRYKAALKTLNPDHLALGWFDLPALMDTFKVNDELKNELGPDGELLKDTVEGIRSAGAISFDIHATTTSVVLRTSTENTTKWALKSTNGEMIKRLPAETLFALDVPESEKVVKSILDSAKAEQNARPEGTEALFGDTSSSQSDAAFASTLLGDDVKAVMQSVSGEAVLAIGKTSKVEDLRGALVATTADPGAAQTAVDKLAKSITQDGYVDKPITVGNAKVHKLTPKPAPAMSAETLAAFRDAGIDTTAFAPQEETSTPIVLGVVEGKLILANNEDYFRLVAQGQNPGLGGAAPYAELFGDLAGEPLGSQLFLDVQGIIGLAKAESSTAFSAEEQKWLDHLNVAGMQSWTDGNHEYSEVRLSFK